MNETCQHCERYLALEAALDALLELESFGSLTAKGSAAVTEIRSMMRKAEEEGA